MDGAKTDWKTWVVLVKLAQGKGAARRPKSLFLSYCENVPLIKLTCSGPFRAWKKSEGLSGVMVEKLHDGG